jgi:hypothetical protein
MLLFPWSATRGHYLSMRLPLPCEHSLCSKDESLWRVDCHTLQAVVHPRDRYGWPRCLRLGRSWQDRSRSAFCHPVRELTVAAPTTKVEPLHGSSRGIVGRHRAVRPLDLCRRPWSGTKGSRSRRQRYCGVQGRCSDLASLERERRTAHEVRARLDACAGSLRNYGAAYLGQYNRRPCRCPTIL